jgi:VRR-NUC domain-containing protein
VRLLDNEVGFDEAHKVRYGLGNGSPDLVGVLRNGRCVGLEVKTAGGRVAREQTAWMTAARKWGVFCCVVRSIDEAMAAIERAERGEAE